MLPRSYNEPQDEGGQRHPGPRQREEPEEDGQDAPSRHDSPAPGEPTVHGGILSASRPRACKIRGLGGRRRGPQRRERRGSVRYWEDIKEGEVVELGSRTLDKERMVAFAREFDPQPFHTDETAAEASIWGGLID